MIDLQDILIELDNIKGSNKVRKMIIEYVEDIEDALLSYQEAKEQEIKNLIYYTTVDLQD